MLSDPIVMAGAMSPFFSIFLYQLVRLAAESSARACSVRYTGEPGTMAPWFTSAVLRGLFVQEEKELGKNKLIKLTRCDYIGPVKGVNVVVVVVGDLGQQRQVVTDLCGGSRPRERSGQQEAVGAQRHP